MKLFRNYAFAAFGCLLALAGCDSENGGSGPKSEFDRQAMLANYSTNLILPAYESLNTSTTALETAVGAFTASPSVANLTAARTAYQAAYKNWQQVSVYNFGPADEQLLRTNLNIYPTATAEIEANINAGTYDLQTASNLDTKGFPALDYLLYSAATAEEVVARYTTGDKAANRKKYLEDVTSLIKQRTAAVYSGWTSGNFADTFQKSTGTAVGSAIGSLVNELNSDIDLTKRAKIGIPSGRFTAGSALPEKVEAYFSKTSLELLKQNIRAEKAIFMGQSASGANGLGLDDYLDHVGASYNGGQLSDAVEAQFDAALAAAEAIQGPLSEAVTTQPAAVTKAYDALQKLIVLTKTDMPAALGVTITYTDNDGD
ncbi:imelysin family protein [Pontibacter sp. CAU 1760]